MSTRQRDALAWASTFCAVGVSSRWKNLMYSRQDRCVPHPMAPTTSLHVRPGLRPVALDVWEVGGEHQVVHTKVVAHLDRGPLHVAHSA